MEEKKLEEVWEVNENKNQSVKRENVVHSIWESSGELKEIQEIAEQVQTKNTVRSFPAKGE